MSIAALIGSLRAASVNRVVFDAARELMPDGVELEEVPLADLPLFDEDIEAAGDPAPVTALKDAVTAADGLVIFTPEYNGSVPAVTKNAIDWLSRPFLTGPIVGTPVGIVAAGPGRSGGAGVRAHLAVPVQLTGGLLHEETLGLPRIHASIVDGVLTGDDVRDALRAWLAGFVDFVRDAGNRSDG